MISKPPRKPYPTDLTDAQWQRLQSLLPPPPGGGRRPTTDVREVVNAILYEETTACAWRALPLDFPPEGTVRDYFHRWRRSGVWRRLLDALRSQVASY